MSAREAPPVTLGLIAISVGVFIADLLLEGSVIEWGAKSHLVWAGEWRRLIAANFIHSDVPHLLLDMYALFVFGRIVEGLAGNVRFLAVYLLGGVAGFAVSLLANPAAYSVGSSAAIFALMGYTLNHRLRNLPRRWLPIDTAFAQIFGINLVMGLSVPNIDQFAHAGGLAGGFLLGVVFGDAGRFAGGPAVDEDAGPADGAAGELAGPGGDAAGVSEVVLQDGLRAPNRRGARGIWERAVAAAVLAAVYFAGFFPVTAFAWLRPVAPAAAAAMERRIEKYFAPYVVTDPALLWIDTQSPDWRRFDADATLRLPEWEPIAVAVFWRWTRGGSPEGRAAYTVTWYHRSGTGAPWVRVWEESGVVTRVDQGRDTIYRRGVLTLESPGVFYGDWRVLVDVNGIKQFEKEYAVTR